MLPTQPHTLIHTAGLATMLTIAAIMDARSRQIPNRFWLWTAPPFLISGITLNIMAGVPWWALLSWGTFFTITALVLWILQQWGGADAKGVILFAWASPLAFLHGNPIHPLLYTITGALAISSMIQRIKPEPLPFFVAFSPLMILALIIQ